MYTSLQESPQESEFSWSAQNRLPTPTLSDSSRNTSPHFRDRRNQPVTGGFPSAGLLGYDSLRRVADSTAAADVFTTTSHEIDFSTPTSDRTNAFFSSSSTSYELPTPPHRSQTLSGHRSGSSDKTVTLSRSVSDPHAPPSRSNADIFFSRGTTRPPSPPPPLSSSASRTPSVLPPLSRFFPSRYRRNSHDYFEQDPPQESLSTPQPSSNTNFAFTPSTRLDPVPAPRPWDVPREPLPTNSDNEPSPGTMVEMDDLKLTFIRHLGKGAFSSVWLAQDDGGTTSHHGLPREHRPSESFAWLKKDKKMDGLRPTPPTRNLSFSTPKQSPLELDPSAEDNRTLDVSAEDHDRGRTSNEQRPASEGRVVAVKMMELAMCDANDRTRISFVREVEVLRHISHPNIVSYLHSYTTPTHHCLVLEYLGGGELFELLNTDANHAKMTELLLRRLWGELALAVGWMHEVALVHRDIKLENILLTCNPFTQTYKTPAEAVFLPSPLLKITDFGLARFIDPANPLLTTRCGSEYYAAPEIIMGKAYDGRKTDAWASGVVLYAMATRYLPFDQLQSRPTPAAARGRSSAIVGSPPSSFKETKRRYLMRIAKGEYHWPDGTKGTSGPSSSSAASNSSTCSSSNASPTSSRRSSFASSSRWVLIPEEVEPHPVEEDPASRLATEGVRRIVGKLLVRDPEKRARLVDLWGDEWFRGLGAPHPPPEASLAAGSGHHVGLEASQEEINLGLGVDLSRWKASSESGHLVEADDIPSLARQDAT